MAQGADKTGPLAGVPYDGKLTKADGKGKWWDGLDPQDLYEQRHTPSPNFDKPGAIHDRWDWNNGVEPAGSGLLRQVLQPHRRSHQEIPSRLALF